MKTFRKFIAALPLALGLSLAQASGGGYPLDHFPVEKLTDVAALQSGAKLFVNYCLNCHGASSMRYNRLQDIGLTEDQIRKNLLFSAEKVGEQMKVHGAGRRQGMVRRAAARPVGDRTGACVGCGSGADWLYTYLRSYYRDSTRATGWNNALFENVGMPHVFWELQGTRGVTHRGDQGGQGRKDVTRSLVSRR
jgi:ubiquinol-cytochrome c reductase cytochrome c1 subunit